MDPFRIPPFCWAKKNGPSRGYDLGDIWRGIHPYLSLQMEWPLGVMVPRVRTTAVSLLVVLLLVVASPVAVQASTPPRVVHSATASFAGRYRISTTGLTKFSPGSGIVPTAYALYPGVWAGYSQVAGLNDLAGGVDGWVLPAANCDSASAYPQYTALLAWYDGVAGNSFYAGVVFYCKLGQSGPAAVYFGDAFDGFYGGIASVGDEVTAYVYAYNSTSVGFRVTDWTTGGYLSSHWKTGSQIPYSDFDGVLDTYAGCTTATHICPQVTFGTVNDGTAFFTSLDVVCAFNADGTVASLPCAGYRGVSIAGTYYFPIGSASGMSSVTTSKYDMRAGDTSTDKAFTTTGGLYTDEASHTYTFVRE